MYTVSHVRAGSVSISIRASTPASTCLPVPLRCVCSSAGVCVRLRPSQQCSRVCAVSPLGQRRCTRLCTSPTRSVCSLTTRVRLHDMRTCVSVSTPVSALSRAQPSRLSVGFCRALSVSVCAHASAPSPSVSLTSVHLRRRGCQPGLVSDLCSCWEALLFLFGRKVQSRALQGPPEPAHGN